LNIQYDIDIIKNTISDLSQKLSTLTHLRSHIDNYNKLLSLELHIKNIELEDHEIENIEELESLNRERTLQISELKKGLELLTCPKCSTPLKYKDKTLIIGDRVPTSKSQISEIEKSYTETCILISKIRKLVSLRENIVIVKDTLKDVSIKDLENYINVPGEINKVSNLINQLSQIKFIEMPILDGTHLTNIFNYRSLLEQKKSLEKQINQIDEDGNVEESQLILNNYMEDLNKLENDYTYQQKIKSGLENIIGALSQHRKEIVDVENKLDDMVKIQYIECKNLLDRNKEKLVLCQWKQKCNKREQILNYKKEKVDQLHKDVTALERLKQKAIEIEFKQLYHTVENINTVLETTLPIFFTQSIEMKLSLFKTLKNKKHVKPGLNLEIIYKGVKYDNINFLSGGEGDRLSLALLLALNSVSNSPIIMLDECVSSLDANLKESCIEAIKKIPDKTIICVDHEGVEGFYDKVIEL